MPKKNVSIIYLKITIAIIALTIILIGCKKSEPPDIEVIYVRNYNISYYYEYKIDLKNKQYSKAGPLDRSQNVEDYELVCELEDHKIDEFLCTVSEYKLLFWKELYKLPGEHHDGHQWSIKVIFTDSTSTGTNGDNHYPDTYDEMRIALKNLTGYVILDEKQK